MIAREIIERIAKEGCKRFCNTCPINSYCCGYMEYSKQIAELYLKAYPEKPNFDSMTEEQAESIWHEIDVVFNNTKQGFKGELKQIYKILTEEIEPENEWFVFWDNGDPEVGIASFESGIFQNEYKIPDLSKYLNEPRTVENWEQIVKRDKLEEV